MFHKLYESPRVQFLIIAAALSAGGIFLGLSAYLTDRTDPFKAHFLMETGGDLEVSLNTDLYEEDAVITPGETADYDPYLTNDGSTDAYVFIKVKLPDKDISLAGINDHSWELVSSSENEAVYAYSTDGELTVLPGTKPGKDPLDSAYTDSLCTGIALAEDTMLNDSSIEVTATGYAIQSNEFSTNVTPADVWKEIGK